MLNKRELMVGAVSVAATTTLPNVPVLSAPIPASTPLLSFIVGSDCESNWQWIKAVDQADAFLGFMDEHCGCDGCEVVAAGEAKAPPEDCDCEWCYLFNSLDTSRVKQWDDREYTNPPSPAEWLKAGYTYECACGMGPLALNDGAFICNDGTVECEYCHDKRIERDRFRAAQRDLEQDEKVRKMVG